MQAQLKKLTLAAAAAVAVVATAVPADAYLRVSYRPHRTIVVSKPRPVRTVVLAAGKPAAVIDFNVTPKATRIWIDGSYRGTCAEFDGQPRKMVLRPGSHHLKLVTPDGIVVHRDVFLTAGNEINLNIDF